MAASPYTSYTQLAEALKVRIASGDLQSVARMPSEQGLAGELGVSRGMVQRAYRLLEQEGVLARRQGQRWKVVGASEHARSDVSYEDLAATLRKWLRENPQRDDVPTGNALAKQHGVSLDTVRQARQLLVAEGVIVRAGQRYVRAGGARSSRVAEVAEAMRTALEREHDEVAPNGRLIGEKAWMERARASKKTVQAALSLLEAEGLITPAMPGKSRQLATGEARQAVGRDAHP